LSFDHGLSSDETFSWQALVESGAHLLDTLLRLREDEKVGLAYHTYQLGSLTKEWKYQEYPLLFVCHGLGGIIIKKA
jgi:hypothetical protein